MKNLHHRVTKHPTLLQQEAQGRNDIEESYHRGDDGVLEEQRQLLGKSNNRSNSIRAKSYGWATAILMMIPSILMVVSYYNHYNSIETPPSSIKNEPRIKVYDVPNDEEVEEAVNELIKYTINEDSRCHWEDGNYEPEGSDNLLIGKDDSYNLGGLCQYSFPLRQPPPEGYLKEIDHPYLRAEMENREQCFMDCVDVLINNMPNMISDQLLLDASITGLPRVVKKLLSLNLDPLYRPTGQGDWHAKTNSIQRAIQGGHANIVKLLTKGNNNLVIDSEGRTVKDYIQLKGSPVRPYFAESILGLNVQSTDPNLRSRRPLKTKYMDEIGDSGWSSYTAYEYDETRCDMDIVYGELSKEDFFRDYYIPGRPFVLRQSAPVEEVRNFHKHRFETTDRFDPSNKFR